MEYPTLSGTVTEIEQMETTTRAAPSCCSYCSQTINGDNFLLCLQCQTNVHVHCLRHASTPGDFYGDVFFEFTCAKCMLLQIEDSSPNSNSSRGGVLPREKFVRQRLPWFMIITLTLYNLAIKSKGLSRQGYFHWRSHISNFIEKNWDYLFESGTRRCKNWIGSISGNLSHNSPDFFLSGQEVFNEAGWWKLTYENQTPKYIYKRYEQSAQKRQQRKNDRRQIEDISDELPMSSNEIPEAKRRRTNYSDEDLFATDSCGRTIPYMGRKPKMAKQLNIDDDEFSRSIQTSQSTEPQEQEHALSTVQSNLMDFLAENLGTADLSIFQHLPNIAPEPLVGGEADRNDFLSLMDADAQDAVNFFEVSESKSGKHSKLENCSFKDNENTSNELVDGKLKSYADVKTQAKNFSNENSLSAISECSIGEEPDEGDSKSDEDLEIQPRVVQVTNFQQLNSAEQLSAAHYKQSTGKQIKQETKYEAEHPEGEHMANENMASLPPCKPCLFTKQPRRKFPWLVSQPDPEELTKAQKENKEDKEEKEGAEQQLNEKLVMMSEYEERKLYQEMRKIFSLEKKRQLQIPVNVRRFYRKLCVRARKREYNKPVFDFDKLVNRLEGRQVEEETTNIIDRYQLISLTSQNPRKSFYERLTGSSDYEMFLSPYTQRMLHPVIFRDKECFPDWVKLLCEIKYSVSGVPPPRAPIDFFYVRPNHIPAVNALLQNLFWPGIDMSDCLSYPDFSVVALYRRLVIGCGFLVPDVGFNEAYISFMGVRPGWQRCGIATIMLYHLIQTCRTKDITLHVSATNPAVMLYQKFGFKMEEIVLNFYEKYLPFDSKHSRNAFFLRLQR